ncbi:MAG: DUF3343 domain-containing protein [Oscillibacter sp.]|nr:DUF3343 domain-containing protein [Oscillibacter sp.]
MRERSEKCVVTFRTTAGAMAMEAACKAQGVPGRLIPVPRSVTAGCGLCWAAPPDSREAVEELVMKKGLDVDGIYAIIL